jgi:adenosyl cobinamide kinase/adenosyl cobinamide phosphate guanylyltransferase
MWLKQSTRTQLHVTDMDDSDVTLQAAESTAEGTAPMFLHEAEIEDDNDLAANHQAQRDEDSQINNNIVDLIQQITQEDRRDVVTQNCLMLQLLLEHQDQSKVGKRLGQERMVFD